ncbi:MAG: hypothetical protein C0524_10485 [Rhodobacter sp.]|nr:hypothetical protein [Rhodobacter sp.]
MTRRPSLALVLDPRFGGGTSSAVAREILALAPDFDLRVAFIESGMFRGGRAVHPRIVDALEETGIGAAWDPPVIQAETIVLHNPSFLKFDTSLKSRLNCARAVVVAHENFLKPDGTEGFDVGKTLAIIAARLPPCPRTIAPVSRYNRRTVAAWLSGPGAGTEGWDIAPVEWFNICDFALLPPTASPRDRRGRVSRAGFEKFPDMATMLRHFPPHADHCAILGADTFLLPGVKPPPHWALVPFGGAEVATFLTAIDFFVYFTHPNLRESFGRVVAEAIASGKIVITDPGTAETFGNAVIPSDGHDLDQIIAGFIAAPDRYRAFVTAAQQGLAAFSADAFRTMVCRYLQVETRVGELT